MTYRLIETKFHRLALDRGPVLLVLKTKASLTKGDTRMHDRLPDLTAPQWEFLALVEAFGAPVPIDVPAALFELTPGMLFDLVRRASDSGWLHLDEQNRLQLRQDLPVAVQARMHEALSRRHMQELCHRMHASGTLQDLPLGMRARLLEKSGRVLEAAQIEFSAAQVSIAENDSAGALRLLEKVVDRLRSCLGEPASDTLFVSAAVTLCLLRFRQGREMTGIPDLLHQARTVAQRQGDKRSLTLFGLFYGRLYFFEDRHSEALEVLEASIREARTLGDEDILSQSAEFIGLYYFIQGRYREACEYLDRAMQAALSQRTRTIIFTLPRLLGYCFAILGRFHQAIGVLDSNWRRALMKTEPALATNFRIPLGTVLLMMGKRSEAYAHLSAGLDEALTQQNHWALFEARISLGYYHFLDGDLKEAHRTCAEGLSEGAIAGIKSSSVFWPWFLEMLFEFDRQEFAPLLGESFPQELDRVLAGANINLHGTALALLARLAGHGEAAEDLLIQSEKALLRSGDPIQLAKTRAALARLKLHEANREEALKLALQAWEGPSGFGQGFFPDDLRPLLRSRGALATGTQQRHAILLRFMRLMEDFVPGTDQVELLTRLVAASSRFFEAERGGLFWVDPSRPRRRPALKAAYNLSRREVESSTFQAQLELIGRVLRNNTPVVLHPAHGNAKDSVAILCLPFDCEGRIQGVLYHENTYVDERFELFDRDLLQKFSSSVGLYIDRITRYCRPIAQVDQPLLDQVDPSRNEEDILAQSVIMQDLLERAQQAGQSDASVLILGETGVGKELMARHIHAHSPRRNGPFAVVDLSSMPENLVESELFGHEKGAFTGATARKLGRIELAHQGTLFIDEVGDIPASMQIKLLRTLQNQSFMRLGGIRTLSSDFRLIAATNRNLSQEVSAGNFREDLFYRLNVVPLIIPPLRDRQGDVILLAEHFLRYFAGKYHRPTVHLNPQDRQRLQDYPWPGNVRELRNIIERTVILSSGSIPELSPSVNRPEHPFADCPSLDELQRRYILWTLERTGGRIGGPGGAAEALGMNRTTLNSRIRNLGIVPPGPPR